MVRPGSAFDALASKNSCWFTPGASGDSVKVAVGPLTPATVTFCVTLFWKPRSLVTISLTAKLPRIGKRVVTRAPLPVWPLPKSTGTT